MATDWGQRIDDLATSIANEITVIRNDLIEYGVTLSSTERRMLEDLQHLFLTLMGAQFQIVDEEIGGMIDEAGMALVDNINTIGTAIEDINVESQSAIRTTANQAADAIGEITYSSIDSINVMTEAGTEGILDTTLKAAGALEQIAGASAAAVQSIQTDIAVTTAAQLDAIEMAAVETSLLISTLSNQTLTAITEYLQQADRGLDRIIQTSLGKQRDLAASITAEVQTLFDSLVGDVDSLTTAMHEQTDVQEDIGEQLVEAINRFADTQQSPGDFVASLLIGLYKFARGE